MDAVSHFKRLFEYDHWANRETLRAIVASDPYHSETLRIMSHILGAQRLWLDRLHGDEPLADAWPTLTAAECEEQVRQLEKLWSAFLEHQREDKLLRPISYVSTKGQPWANRTGEILMHVVIHSAHHRGQIASVIRNMGHAPPPIDFVHAVRTGLVQ
jgi:uncharacterized damage-inducible protein DinB